MKENSHGVKRKELHRMVDRVLDSGNALVINAMLATLEYGMERSIPTCVSPIEAIKKQDQRLKENIDPCDAEGRNMPAHMINSPESIKAKGTNGGRP